MKLKLFIWCCILQSIYGSKESNIFNGTAPHVCSLQLRGSHHCNGAILNKRWIITAAHCVNSWSPSGDEAMTEIVVGTNCLGLPGGKRYAIESNVRHPKYTLDPYYTSDIGLIKVKEDIEFNERVQPINISSQAFPENAEAFLAGWDRFDLHNEHECLRMSEPKVHNTERCKQTIWGHLIDQTHICIFSDYLGCFDNDGSPLSHNNQLIGVKNFGNACQGDNPEAFAKVSYFYDWIQKHIN